MWTHAQSSRVQAKSILILKMHAYLTRGSCQACNPYGGQIAIKRWFVWIPYFMGSFVTA